MDSAAGFSNEVIEAGDRDGLRITRTGEDRPRKAAVFAGLTERANFGVHNNNLNNGRRALVERVFRSPIGGVLLPPPPCTANLATRLGGVTRAIKHRLGEHRPVSYATFVGYYTGRRKALYENAVESLRQRPITERDFEVSGGFVKAEKINFSAKSDPAPRAIQPRNPRYNVEVGRYLRPLEHHLYEAIGEAFGGPTVMKGYSAEGVAQELRGMWEEFNSPIAIGLDASRFDQHVRAEMLEWEHSVYLGAFRRSDRQLLAWLLTGQIRNRCTMRCADGRIKYRVLGSRMSGDMNTASGNCLIMCALVHALCTERGIGKFRLANNGDDCTLIIEAGDLHRLGGLEAWFLEFGFRMKVEPVVRVFERIVFCQSSPVWDGARWVMVRDPRISLSKDAICLNRNYSWGTGARKWLFAVGSCGLRMTGGIPVLQDYYTAFLRGGVDGLRHDPTVHETGMYMLARGCRRGYVEPTDAARVSFWLAFGISPTEQRLAEAHYRTVELNIPLSPGVEQSAPPTFYAFW